MAPTSIKSVTVIGAGHVGAPHAITLAKKCPNVRVTVVDDDERKIAAWRGSLLPFYEPGLQETVEEVRGTNLFFETDMSKAVAGADLICVSVSTPLKEGGMGKNYAPDLQHWERIARLIAEATSTPKIIVERSTVPVKTADTMAKVLSANSGGKKWVVLSNPEFAREGNAMLDHAAPERVMIGADASPEAAAAAEALSALYRQWVPADKVIVSGLWSAELSKLTANAFLAQRISSINSISALCEVTGADVSEVAYAIGVDSRIGRKHLMASVGFGGACYETHLRNLVYLCRAYRLPQVALYWESVLKMNDYQKRRFASKIVASMFNTVSGKKLAILGFAYKKNTSDTRFSVAIDVCRALLAEKAHLAVHDPRVSSEAVGVAFTGEAGTEELLSVEADPYLATMSAHAIVVLTEWDQFGRLDFRRIYAQMQKPAFVFDGRNCLNHDELREIGFHVYGIGKPPPRLTSTSSEASEAAKAADAAKAARIKVGAARPEDVQLEGVGSALGGAADAAAAAASRAGSSQGSVTQPPKAPLNRGETLGGMA